ncbi:MAG: glycosyltransferase [Lachnospiraceae bacterium]|nr:glycosyltransferase [Lachnospiraceae bacterium]
MSEIEVSIICVTFNQADYIRDTLEGFLMQKTDFAYEILIHDDVSTDGTVEVLREYQQKYPDKIKLVLEVENQYSKGVDITKDIMLPYVRGRYIAYCEGDDYWIYSGKLQAQYDLLEAHPEISLCYHNAVVYDEDKDELTLNVIKHKSGYITDADTVFPSKGWYPTASSFYRTEYMEDYPNLHAPTGDEGMRCYMACCGKLYFINQAWSVYRKNSNGAWNAKFVNDRKIADRYIIDLIQFMKNYNEYSAGRFEKYFYKRFRHSLIFYIDKHYGNWYTVEQFRSYIEDIKGITEHKADALLDLFCSTDAIRCSDYYRETIKQKIQPRVLAGARLYIYGAGLEATKAIAVLAAEGVDISGLIVSDKNKNEKVIFEPLYELNEVEPNSNVMIWPCLYADRHSVIGLLRDKGFHSIII